MSNDKVNILLVDDHVENLVALEALLFDLGQNLVRVESGLDALRLLLHNEFALIILDVDMPIMNGFETAALIREREKSRHTPIIFLTAVNKNDQHVFRGYSLGAVDYLTKPFVPEVLRAKVAAFVELHKKTEEVKRQAKLLQQIVSELASSNDEIRKLNVELQAERDFVSTVLDTADSIVLIIDTEQKIVRASRAFERILGYSSYETNGRTLSSFFVSAGPWTDLAEAENYWLAKDGSSRLIAWSKTRLTADHVVLTGNDLTERKRVEQQREQFIRAEAARSAAEAAERRSTFLAEASSMLAATLDYEKTLINISRLAIPTFADWCFVYLALEGREISSALIAHVDPEKEQLAQEVEIRPETCPANASRRSRISDRHAGIIRRYQRGRTAEYRPGRSEIRSTQTIGPSSAVVVPIPGRHSVMGVIGFACRRPLIHIGRIDIRAGSGAADQSALENARVYREAQEANRAKDEFLAPCRMNSAHP